MTADGRFFYLFNFFGVVQGQDGQKVVGHRCQLDAREFLLKIKKQAQKGPVIHLW